MYKVTSEIQSFFEKKLPQYFQGYISHPYKTRNASGKLPDAAAANTRPASARTSSTSSTEDLSFTAPYRDKNRGRHAERMRHHRAARESAAAIVPMTRRSRRNIAKMNSLATSGTEDEEEEEEEINDEGSDASSCKSNSASSGSYSSSLLQTNARTRIQTRSMKKEFSTPAQSQHISGKLKNSSVGSVNKDGFTMTLRVRSSLKRKRFYTSEDQESSEEELREQDDDKGDVGMEEAVEGEDCSSEEQSADEREVMGKRSCRIKAKSTVFTHTGRHLRKRTRTRYFEDEEERI